MAEFLLSSIFFVLLVVIGLIAIGIYLLSKMVGGFGNLRSIYKLFRGTQQQQQQQKRTRTQQASSSSSTRSTNARSQQSRTDNSSSNGEKVFGQNEGTYVDFEEVK